MQTKTVSFFSDILKRYSTGAVDDESDISS